MEELVNKLAELQVELKEAEANADDASLIIDAEIEVVESELTKLRIDRTNDRFAYSETARKLQATIEETKTQLIDGWDGKKKTLNYLAGTVSFRQTGSLHISDGVRLMELLIEKAPVADIVSEYSKGFKLTGVKKFVEVHNVQTGVASMEYKTTVSLKTE